MEKKLSSKVNEILENPSVEDKINNKSITWTDRITAFFNKIEFLDLDGEKKAEVATKVKQNSTPDKLFWMEIFLSGVIATLGLLQNSVAVVIGAMLIAPFLRPMNGIGFAIARGERAFFLTPVKVLFLSVLMSIGIGFIITKLIGLDVETSEILSRTSPNIIDLFIAIFSAMVAVLSLGYSRLSESIAGVAMAAALMPPLSVVGIELAFNNYGLAWGAMMLFLANLVSIVLVATIFFWLYGFTPHNDIKQKSVVKRFLFLITVILIISIPLIHSLILIKEKINITKESNIYLSTILKQKTSDFTIDKLEVKSFNDNLISLYAIIKIPEGLNFYDTFKKQLDFELSKKFGRKVELEIELIRVANIISDENKVSIRDKMYDFIKDYFKENYKKLNILSLDIENNFEDGYLIKVVFGTRTDYNQKIFNSLKQSFYNKFKENVNFIFIPLQEYSKKKINKNELIRKQKEDEVKKQFEDFVEMNKLGNMNISKIFVDYDLLNKSFIVDINFNVEYKSTIAFNNFMNKFIKFIKDMNNVKVKTKVFIFKQFNLSNLNVKKQLSQTGSKNN